jgi:Rhs element Vgr protein
VNAIVRPGGSDLTTYTLKANGQVLTGDFKLEYLDVRRMANRIATAEIAFIDGSASSQDFALSATDEMRPGTEIEIALGYSSNENVVFTGVLVCQQIKVARAGQSRLILRCRDAAYKLAMGAHSGHYSAISDSDLINLLASNQQLVADVENTSVTHTDIVQLRQTDWDLIVQRAERNGLYVNTENGQLQIKSFEPSEPVIVLAYGQNILDLDLQLDGEHQFSATSAQSWAMAEQSNSTQDGSASLPQPGDISATELAQSVGREQLQLSVDGNVNPQALQAWANAAVERQQLSKTIGTVTFQGDSSVGVGDWVQLQGLGARFNGLAFVGGVSHSCSRGNWLTTIQVGIKPQWHMEQVQGSAGGNTAWEQQAQGVHIGKVVALANDPDGEERIQVKIPILGEDHSGVWSRLVCQDAGDQRGSVFRPEIDDEVVLTFADGDASQPIVLGGLYSSARPAPIAADNDDNNEKGWITRSGMRLVFNDDVVSLTMETPGGNAIVISEDDGSIVIKDQNDNSCTLNSDGIALQSSANVSIEAAQDVSIKGTNVAIESSANLDLKAGANASLEGGAVTKVNGSLVQIN